MRRALRPKASRRAPHGWSSTASRRLRAGVDAMPDHVAYAKRANLLRVQPEILQKWFVDVLTALVTIEVRDGSRDAIHDAAQLRFRGGERVLRLLQVGDVMADDVITLDRSVEV